MSKKILLDRLNGKVTHKIPVWFMRQAGRYLPEYREIRADVPDFLTMCYTPKLAAEVTLQPIRRYGFDGAILFSDILVIPDALGQHVRFEKGEGPRLGDLHLDQLAQKSTQDVVDYLSPVMETIDRVKTDLPKSTTFLGFCGAPFTVASYMIAGKGGDGQDGIRQYYYQQPENMMKLIDILVEASAAYLIAQIKAGVEAVQIFESWASALAPDDLEILSLYPIKRIIDKIHSEFPNFPVIVFAKGASEHLENIQNITSAHAQGVDWSTDLTKARQAVGEKTVLQGNLDPIAILAGGDMLTKKVEAILEHAKNQAFIFNLGHGIRQTTPLENVQKVLDIIRSV